MLYLGTPPIEPHQHAFAMCVHKDFPGYWHQACAFPTCTEDHWKWGVLEPQSCAFCGSYEHFPIDCPKGR